MERKEAREEVWRWEYGAWFGGEVELGVIHETVEKDVKFSEDIAEEEVGDK